MGSAFATQAGLERGDAQRTPPIAGTGNRRPPTEKHESLDGRERLKTHWAHGHEVHHPPPGTSKSNKIEHRLFSFITQNWRAKPLVSYRVIVDLIAATTTKTGSKVFCELDENSYPKGVVVSDDEMARLNIKRADFHGAWNYTIAPSNHSCEALVS